MYILYRLVTCSLHEKSKKYFDKLLQIFPVNIIASVDTLNTCLFTLSDHTGKNFQKTYASGRITHVNAIKRHQIYLKSQQVISVYLGIRTVVSQPRHPKGERTINY